MHATASVGVRVQPSHTYVCAAGMTIAIYDSEASAARAHSRLR
jgi:hypothetical protein